MKKRKFKNYLKLGILLFGVSLFLFNCEKEEVNQTMENNSSLKTVSKKESLTFLNNYKVQAKGNSSNLTYDISKISFENITNSESKLTVIPAKVEASNLYSRILLLKINDTIKSVVYNMYPNLIQETSYFSGQVTLNDFNGKMIKAFRYLNGIMTNAYTLKQNNFHNRSSTDGSAECRMFCGHDSSDQYCICNTQELEGFEITSSNNTIDYVPIADLYGLDSETSGSSNYCEVNCNGWDSGGGNNGNQNDNSDDEIINELTGKADCAYNKLLSSGVSNFHNMITDLFIEFGDNNIGGRDLTFKMSSDLPNDVGGKTQVDSDGDYHILINENLMNTLSSIEVAAILVHEMAHAFLGKHYNNSNSSFTELYEKYINDTGIQNYSHDIMKDQFINRMATAIRNYDSSIFSSFEDYKTLASQGVFELTDDQKDDLYAVKLISRNNDTNCD